MQRSITILGLLLCIMMMPARVLAHSMYQSSVLLDVQGREVHIELQLPPSRLGEALGLQLSAENLQAHAAEIQRYCVMNIMLRDERGRLWTLGAPSTPEWQSVDGAPYVVMHMTSYAAADQSSRRFQIEDHIITDKLPSHAILVTVRSDWQGSTFASDPNLVSILNGREPRADVDLGTGSWMKGFTSVFRLGTRHIAEGTDHLLFLMVLLLPAPLAFAGRRWSGPVASSRSVWRIVAIATAFTVGHSCTLALATFNVLHVPERPIEALIALSIFVSAIHALRPLFPGREAFIAAGFGWIHGLAFATTLADLGLRGWDRGLALLAFNLGIEAMQILVILCILPSLVLLSRTRFYTAFRCAGAAFALLVSVGWMIERVSLRTLGVDRVVNALAQEAPWFALSLFGASVLLYGTRRLPLTRS
ncbi:HupE/UreJ family protein [Granulicella cerasi]|uniref:HupE/UreJ family protein n=1 Tax=Granulicella cerasi TaxID=741063 RepID=A0ABW1ZEI0_9BACT|nr:HupE/UreJ family protein [Granulicella cerasi]